MTTHYASKLIEKQMRNWELSRSQRLAEPPAKRKEVGDFLCLSRMAGIDSRKIADRLGEKLGWPVFDREILETMAGDDFARKQLYNLMDESDLNWSGQVITAFFDKTVLKNDYFRRLCETLLLLARKGNGVFVGRGADLILPAQHGFRVRLAASLDERAGRLAETEGLDETEARREIERVEQERDRFFQHHFGVDASDPARYDVTINVERYSPEQTAELILAARRIRQGT